MKILTRPQLIAVAVATPSLLKPHPLPARTSGFRTSIPTELRKWMLPPKISAVTVELRSFIWKTTSLKVEGSFFTLFKMFTRLEGDRFMLDMTPTSS
jgi:hypothetical protein